VERQASSPVVSILGKRSNSLRRKRKQHKNVNPESGHAMPYQDAISTTTRRGRHAIWLAKQGRRVTLINIDISEIGIEPERQRAAPFAFRIHFVVDDLTHFKASQMEFDVVIRFSF